MGKGKKSENTIKSSVSGSDTCMFHLRLNQLSLLW